MATAANDAASERDYFTDLSVLLDPYDYFEGIRQNGPVYQMKSRDMLLVTGFQEGVEVLLNAADFSSCLNPDPVAPLRFEPEGDDLTPQIEATMDTGPMDLMVQYDGAPRVHCSIRCSSPPVSRQTRHSCAPMPTVWCARWSPRAAAR